LKKGKQGTGKPAQKNQDLLAFLMEGKENQKLLEKHTNARVESEREERKKDRDLLRELFKQ